MDFGCLESMVDERTHVYDNLDFACNGVLPKKYKIVTPIRHQGYSNLCVSFSGTAMAYADAMVRYGESKMLSPTFTQKLCKDIDNVPNATGTTIYSFCKVITKYGACDEDLMPFDVKRNGSTTTYPKITDEMYENAKKNIATSYARISTLDKVKDAIVNQNGCIMCVSVWNNYYADKQGIFLPPPKSLKYTPSGYHAVYVCGYDDEATVKAANGKTYTGFLIIQDSYGEEKDSHGYRFLPYELFNATGYYSKDKLVQEVWCTYDSNKLKNPNYWTDYQKKIDDVMNLKDVSTKVIMYANSNKMIVNGVEKNMVSTPAVISGTTLIPLVSVGEAFTDLSISWDGTKKEVRVKKGSKVFILKANDCKIYDDNGNVVYTSLSPIEIINGRTFVPIRAISEVLGYTVSYESTTKKITIIG